LAGPTIIVRLGAGAVADGRTHAPRGYDSWLAMKFTSVGAENPSWLEKLPVRIG
jgi:hypothetical protein